MTTMKKTPQTTDLKSLSVADLRHELVRGLSLSAESLNYVAAVWHELEARGENLAEFRSGVGRNIQLIASGRLAAEAVVAFIGRPAVLSAIEGLPLARQRELADGGTVAVLTPGDTAPRSVPIAALPTAAIRLVFAGGMERTPEEQRASMVVRPKPKKEPKQKCRVDRVRRVLKVGNSEVPVEVVLAAFAETAAGKGITPEELRGKHASGEGVDMASCLLHPDEAERLEAFCKAKKLDRGDAVRMAVVAMLLM